VLLVGAALASVSCDPGPIVTLTFVGPTEGKRVPPGPVTVKVWWATANCFVDSVELSVDGARVGAVGGASVPDTCVFAWDATGIPLGTRPRLCARAYYSFDSDGVGVNRVDSTWINVRVDTGGPKLAVVTPTEGDTFNKGTVPIVGWARDTGVGGMSRVDFLVDDVLRDSDSFPERDTWRGFWDAAQAAGGNHQVKVIAYNLYDEAAVEQLTIFIRDTATGGGPTYHHGYVDTSETWRAAGNPHICDADVEFRRGARLTIEPGCIIRFDDYSLRIGTQDSASLVAVGTVSAPILFTSNKPVPAPGDWVGLNFGAYVQAGTRLQYCTIEYAGPRYPECAAITMGGGGKVEEIADCTVRRSGMYGIYCREYAGFESFRNNTVTANQGYPLHVDARRADLLDDGNQFSGNDSAGVELYGRLSVSAAWPVLDAPYVIADVRVGDSTASPVLTIAPGAEVRFKSTGVLCSGLVGRNLNARIYANQVTFTANADAPAPGAFYGVNVYRSPSGESEFRNCDFSYGGQGSGDVGMLYARDCGPVIAGCDFGYSQNWGIVVHTAQAPDTLALRQQNTFHDNGRGDIKWVRLENRR
jgi:hypothetical protein